MCFFCGLITVHVYRQKLLKFLCLENKKYEYVSFKMNFNHSSLDYRDSKSTGIISRDIHTTQPINQ